MFKVKVEVGCSNDFREVSEHRTYDEAMKEVCRLFDNGEESDFLIYESVANWTRIRPHTLVEQPCPVCGKPTRQMDMERTYDCHGIPFRYVCYKCKRRIEATKGYDGEYYTEADECIDFDY